MLSLQALLAIQGLMGDFGLGTPAIRRVAAQYVDGDFATARRIIGSVSVVNLASGMPIALLLVLFFPQIFRWSRLDTVYQNDAFWATCFTAGSFLLLQIRNSWKSAYEGAQRYDLVTGREMGYRLSSGIVRLVVLTLFPSLSAVALASLVLVFLWLLLDIVAVSRLLNGLPWPTWAWQEIRPMLGFGGWNYLSSLGGQLYTKVDSLVLTTFLGSAALPYYAVPQRLYSQVHGALGEQSRFLYPLLAAFGDDSEAQVDRLDDRLRWFVAMMSGMVYVSLAFVGPILLSVIVDVDFAAKVRWSLILACIQGFIHAQMIVPYYSSWAIGRGAPNAVLQLVHGGLVLATAALLIPRLGFVGASIAQLWVLPVFVTHTLWVRKQVSPNSPRWTWLHALVSPVLMIIIWATVTEIGVRLISPSWFGLFLLVLVGGMVGLVVVVIVELIYYQDKGRLETLKRAIGVVRRRRAVIKT